MIEIIPTVVPASLADVEAAAAKYAPFAPVLHVDFADGIFAPNTTWPYTKPGVFSGEIIPRISSPIILEAHLMVSNPADIGVALARAGFARIIGHVEAMREKTPEVFTSWKSAGASRVGIGICAQTAPDAVDPYIGLSDAIMLMTITSIGVQGLPSDPQGPARAAALHAKHPHASIEVDGAINESNIAKLAGAGARSFCAGSVLSKAADPASTYRSLLALAESGVQPRTIK